MDIKDKDAAHTDDANPDSSSGDPQPAGDDDTGAASSTMSVVDMLMGKANEKIFDFDTAIHETQVRVWKALKEGYEYDGKADDSDIYLRGNVLSHVRMAVLYVDLVGSTKMALEMPSDKVAIIMSSFAQEMASVIRRHNGYVLKFVGDAVIGYFVTSENRLMTADNAVNCARHMLSVIRDGINPVLDQYDYPELKVKIGIDAGMSIVVRYGSDVARSHVDLIGPVMNISAKIQNKAAPNQILIGVDVYSMLHPDTRRVCSAMQWGLDEWSYRSRVTGEVYGVYEVSPLAKGEGGDAQ